MSDQVHLASEPDFNLGGLDIRPSERRIVAADGIELLQPRIMQVLVALAARRGDVVSRDELMARCWGGFAVSDDAIHRCVARLRRISETYGGFRLETVPRVGYQLVEVNAPPRPRWDYRRAVSFAAGAGTATLVFAAGLIGAHFF